MTTTVGITVESHRQHLLQQIAVLIKIQNEHNQNIPFRCLYCNVYSPSRVVILQHINQTHKLSMPMVISRTHSQQPQQVQAPQTSQTPQIEVEVEPKKEEKEKEDKEDNDKESDTPDYALHFDEASGRWNCSRCTSSFAQRSTLRTHLREKHSVDIPKLKPGRPRDRESMLEKKKEDRKCPFCAKTYSSVYYLKKHTQKAHGQPLRRNTNGNGNENVNVDMNVNVNMNMNMSINNDGDVDTDMDSSTYSDSIENTTESQDEDMSEPERKSQSQFTCDRCDKVCTSALDLLLHVAQHEDH